MYKYLNGMAVFQSIKIESNCVIRRGKLCPDVILGKAVIHTQILDPRRKTFIQPQMSPPFLTHNPPVGHRWSQTISRTNSYIFRSKWQVHSLLESSSHKLNEDEKTVSKLQTKSHLINWHIKGSYTGSSQ